MSQLQLNNFVLKGEVDCDSIELTIHGGQLVALSGDINSGAESILDVLFGEHLPKRGKIRYNGEPIPRSEKALEQWRRKGVILVSERLPMLEWLTVQDNLLLALQIRGMNKRKALKKIDEALCSDNLEPLAGDFPGSLNVQQRSQILLWRAMLCQPQLLLIEQVLRDLPAELRGRWYQRFELLRRERQTIVVIFSSDLLELCQQADYLLAFEYGDCVAHGEPQELMLRSDCVALHRLMARMNPLQVLTAEGLAIKPSLCLPSQVPPKEALRAMQSKQCSYAYLTKDKYLVGGLSLYQAHRAVQQKSQSLQNYLDLLPTIDAHVSLAEVFAKGPAKQRDLAVIDHNGYYLGQLRYKQVILRLNALLT
ncbi:MAG: Glycine betaine/proline betaine transport system ATP-binding protein ProV [Candidatus Celerinatantimonas neptuna]|nr:MAG: Glycine betaine/proline betaine transport system ATP-binding protein ProV [Candidatus Celerinatantimonas neptuna]